MEKTTVYLPGDLKAALERVAREEGRSEAEILREALQARVASRTPVRPKIPLTGSGLGDPTLAERTEELLSGFGGG